MKKLNYKEQQLVQLMQSSYSKGEKHIFGRMYCRRAKNNTKLNNKAYYMQSVNVNPKMEDFTIEASNNHRLTRVSYDKLEKTKTVIITDSVPFTGAKKVDNNTYQRTIIYNIEPIVKQVKHLKY
jgi:hypothetical protein